MLLITLFTAFFSFDWTMRLNIWLFSSFMLKFAPSKLVLMNTQLSSYLFLFLFLFHSQYFYHYDLIHQFLLPIYGHKNKDQSCSLKQCIEFVYLLLWMFWLLSIKLIWLNPKSDLNLIVFESDKLDCIITGIKISSWTYIECLMPLINLALSILCFLIYCFVS